MTIDQSSLGKWPVDVEEGGRVDQGHAVRGAPQRVASRTRGGAVVAAACIQLLDITYRSP